MRLAIRSISAAAIAAACLALAACSSGSPGNAAAGQRNAASAGPGRPASGGTVTVKQGNKVICVTTVVNGTGTCKVPARRFGVGTSQVSASYTGSGDLSGHSGPVSMTVAAAPTTTTLTLSPAKVSYGGEQAGRLSVTVTAAYGGTPAGAVKVTSGGTTACLITLAPAKGGGAQGSCALPARGLAVGARPLTAIYAGDHWYRGSVSASRTLTVTKLRNGTGAPAPTCLPNPLSSVTLSDKPQVRPVSPPAADGGRVMTITVHETGQYRLIATYGRKISRFWLREPGGCGRPAGVPVLSARFPRQRVARACLAGLAAALTATGCSLIAGPGAHPPASPVRTAGKGAGQAASHPSGRPAAVTRPMAGPAGRGPVPVPAVSLLAGGTPSSVTAQFSQRLFASSPVVVVAAATSADPGSLRAASSAAGRAHAPLLLAPPPPAAAGTATSAATAPAGQATPANHATSVNRATSVNAGFIAAIKRLAPQVVLVAGLPATPFARQLGADVSVVTSVSRLPRTGAPTPLRGLAVLVPPPGPLPSPMLTAVTVTARDAGAAVIPVPGGDPRADAPVIAALARQRPRQVIGVGPQFGAAVALRERVSVAMTGVQLPGGGQLVFPGRRLVALYGHPGTPALGVLGQQGLAASVARALQTAARYVPLSGGLPVVPAFEIIATVAEASAGRDKTYSSVTPVADIEPWVRRASAAGMYVVLDLQPGRARLLAQAQQYAPLLRLPNVGLALDAEWKLQPAQLPLKQIGHVDVSEVNAVISWLATLTGTYRLPQKLLVLHQFQLQMIRREASLDTSHDDLAIVVHMDGQGTPAMKQATWNAVVAALPHGVFLGWKDFLVKDHPMLSPRQTMTQTPTPVMISYQ